MKLENQFLKVDVDEPGFVYRGTRFDWTAFIRQVTFEDRVSFCTSETACPEDLVWLGAGFCNEFGIMKAVGYETCPVGGQFPKIGVGLLTRDSDEPYRFFKPYTLQPASVRYDRLAGDAVSFLSESSPTRGFSSRLTKTVRLVENLLILDYVLVNTGEQDIRTNEYCHNFLAIGGRPISPEYQLDLSFPVEPQAFGEAVNPNGVVLAGRSGFGWRGNPDAPFFFSQLGKPTEAGLIWKLRQTALQAEVSESVWPLASSVNLWGTGHVVSPEVFVEINLKPGEDVKWTRRFTFSASDPCDASARSAQSAAVLKSIHPVTEPQ